PTAGAVVGVPLLPSALSLALPSPGHQLTRPEAGGTQSIVWPRTTLAVSRTASTAILTVFIVFSFWLKISFRETLFRWCDCQRASLGKEVILVTQGVAGRYFHHKRVSCSLRLEAES